MPKLSFAEKQAAIRRLTRSDVAKKAKARVEAEWQPASVPWYNVISNPLAYCWAPPQTAWLMVRQGTPMLEALEVAARHEGQRPEILRKLVLLLCKAYPKETEILALAEHWSQETQRAFTDKHPWVFHGTVLTELASILRPGKNTAERWGVLAWRMDRELNPEGVANEIRELWPEPPNVHDFDPRLAEYDEELGWHVRYGDGSIWCPHSHFELDEIEPEAAGARMLHLARDYRNGCRCGAQQESEGEVEQEETELAGGDVLTVTAGLSRTFIDALYVNVLGQSIAELVEDRTTSAAAAVEAEKCVYAAVEADAPKLVSWLEIVTVDQATSDLGDYRGTTTCLPQPNPVYETELRRYLVEHLQWAVCVSVVQTKGGKHGKGEA